jgi:hypothetical protein
MDVMRQVHIGMKVVDSAGEELGTVDDLKFGDAEAITGVGQVAPGDSGGLTGGLRQAFGGESRLDSQAAARLVRGGYIDINREGLLSGHAYAEADWIQAVDNDTVRLSVPSFQLHND